MNYKNYAALNCWLFWIITDLKWQFMIKNCNGLVMAQVRFDTLWAWLGLIWTLYGPGPDWIGHFSIGLAQIRLDTLWALTGLDISLWARPKLDCDIFSMGLVQTRFGHFPIGLAQTRFGHFSMGLAQTGFGHFSVGRFCPRPRCM